MAGLGMEEDNRLAMFLESGIYRLPGSNTVFLDPVRILNRNYSRFRVSPWMYYSRFFDFKLPGHDEVEEESRVSISTCTTRKRKRKPKKKKSYAFNDAEKLADRRHQEARPLVVKAHEAFLGAKELLEILPDLRSEAEGQECIRDLNANSVPISFVELGRIWQAPLYEITLMFDNCREGDEPEGSHLIGHNYQRVVPAFNNLVSNETSGDMVADFLGGRYILPRESCFYMSELEQIHNFLPAESDCGFNLILIDPPWENRSAHQKSMYPTLPNRYFLSLPIKQLTHTEGALVALWVTNREKLRRFVEKELFPAWGVEYAATIYWLKVKADGSLICHLDLFHHRPYECLLLGYSNNQVIGTDQAVATKRLKNDQVIIMIPGDYSRKPPLGELLLDCVPGPKPARCIELFARELMAGWTSWGNEPLHFQDSRFFQGRR